MTETTALWMKWAHVQVEDRATGFRGDVTGVTSDGWFFVNNGDRTVFVRPADAVEIPQRQPCPGCGGNGWKGGHVGSQVCDRGCGGSGTVLRWRAQ